MLNNPILYQSNPRLHLHDYYTLDDMYDAYFSCIKRKRGCKTFKEFNIDCHRYLRELLEEINTETYTVSPLYHFVVTWPKAREVWASQFRDRIVHHLLYNDLGDFYLSRFIDTNCACIKNKGTGYAVRKAVQFCRSITQNWSVPAYVLKFDITNFFVSINKEILWELILRSINYQDSLTTRLFKTVLFKNPVINAVYCGNPKLKECVPLHKRLANAKYNHGLPIGDLTSQLCASGIYLDELDKYIKHTLKCKYYVRYVDDGIILDTDRKRLRDIQDAIEVFLFEKLELILARSKTSITPLYGGFDFLGKRILPYRIYTKNRITDKALRATIKISNNPHPKKINAVHSVNSYFGMLRTTQSFNIRKAMCEFLFAYRPELALDMLDYTQLYQITCDDITNTI